MTDGRFLLYGANGYTGVLMVREAVRRGLSPILAGRREASIRPLAEEHGLEWRVFPLDTPEAIAPHLEDVSAVALAAGPFSRTSDQVVRACLTTKTHYTDITGEIAIFEACHGRDAEAKRAGVSLMPGVGFDVVPTDCMAASLAAALPTATRLYLAFASDGSSSVGTTKTMVEGLPHGGMVRRGGALLRVPPGHASRVVPFRDRPRHCVAIPWGDVSTAYYSTGIGDIEVYMAFPKAGARLMRATRHVSGLLGTRAVQRGLERLVELTVKGPDDETNRVGRSQIWGRVEDDEGRSVEGTLVTPTGYPLTALTSVDAAHRCATGETRPGALTPSMAFGADYVTRFEGCDLRIA